MWANDLLVGSEISWWFPKTLPQESGLIGMVPKNPATRVRINRNGSHSSGSEISCDTGVHIPVGRISDLKVGNLVPTLPDAGRYLVSTGTGWPCVSIL